MEKQTNHSSAATLDIERLDLDPRVRLTSEAKRLLLEHPDLAAVLQEAWERLPAYFDSAELRVELVYNPEEAGEPLLHAAICSDLSFEEARDAFDAFGREWWYAAEDRVDFALAFGLESL